MTKAELAELIRNGENSGVKFKRDDIRPEGLAGELAALLNLEGGRILLGVESDGSVSGLSRDSNTAEGWVMQVARDLVQPAIVPYWEMLRWTSSEDVGVLTLASNAPGKPYKSKRGEAWVARMRAGTTTRDATRDEERLLQRSGRLRHGRKPVPGTTLDALDRRRLRDYFVRVLDGGAPSDDDADEWRRLLCNLNLAVLSAGRVAATIDGILLFGNNPKHFLPQSGIRAVCYRGVDPDSAMDADGELTGPLLPLGARRERALLETGLVDKACDFVRRNTEPSALLEGPRRIDRWEYPEAAVREAIVNAVVHRDYSIAGTNVMLAIYADRLEVVSPGSLPSTVTPEGMRFGQRHARNQTLVNVMRDYGYIDARSIGVRNKIIPAMRAHNGTEPDLIEEERRFTVRLRKA